jgi:hypothetical protein
MNHVTTKSSRHLKAALRMGRERKGTRNEIWTDKAKFKVTELVTGHEFRHIGWTFLGCISRSWQTTDCKTSEDMAIYQEKTARVGAEWSIFDYYLFFVSISNITLQLP